MSLADIMESQFRADVRFRGAAYIQSGRVSISHITENDVYAIVRDGGEHQIHLHRTETALEMNCSSVAGTKRAPTTKYVWATILLVDELGYMTGQPRPGYIPPFRGISAYEQDEDWEEDDLDDDAYFPPINLSRKSTALAEKAKTDKPTRTIPEWQQRLRSMRDRLKTRDITREAKPTAYEITYQLDIAESWKTGHLTLQIVECQRRAAGGWGKTKPLKLKAGGLESLPEADDRAILSHLLGGIQERAGAQSATTALNQHLPYRFHLTHSLSTQLLPRICATNRLRLMNEEGQVSEPLDWGSTEPWDLTLCIEPANKEESEWRIAPVLIRDQETMRIEQADLIVEGGWVISNGLIEPVEDFEVFEWVRAHRSQELPTFPDEAGPVVVQELMTLPSVPRLQLPEKWKIQEKHVVPRPRLKLFTPSVKSAMPRDRLQADLEFIYDDLVVRGSTHSWAIPLPDDQACIVRDHKQEEACWSQLQSLGLQRIDDRGGVKHDVMVPLRELTDTMRALFETNWEIRSDDKPFRQPGEVTFRVESGIDWFDVTGDVDYGPAKVSVPALLSALARGERTIQLEDGSLGFIPEEWKERFGVLLSLGESDSETLRFSSSQAVLVEALLATQDRVDYDQKFLEWKEKLANFNGVSQQKENAQFQGELRDYQREGLGWLKFLEEFQFGGCLADDMGLGKTIQVLAFLSQRYEGKPKHDPTLIVVPKSLLFNWQREIQRFTPQLTALEYSGAGRSSLRSQLGKYDIVLMTYATLRRDIMAIKEFQFDCVVLDEAQAIKNPGSQIAKATRLLHARQRLALSGTPIENHLGDMWSIFEFLNPGLLGRSSVFKSLSSETDSTRLTEAVANGLKPFVLRRTKEKVASDLPDRVEETLYCKLSGSELKLYNEMRDYYRQSIFSMVDEQGLGKTKMHVLEALLRLRQAACHPGLLDPNRKEERSTKLDVLVDHLQELRAEGHKTLVFSQFTSLLSIVRHHLEQEQIPYTYLDGSTKNRDEVVSQFQDDAEIPVFLISLKAGGLGLNLTAAGYVFLLDPWWNPAVEAQAIDRA
ncbi:MAG: DEAD/DEAH box helicase family protein, partial [Planctomycetaceae bacterium]|nr:DEAD/DEAH box helicase family protein [Planctomycetaceae bacterium]